MVTGTTDLLTMPNQMHGKHSQYGKPAKGLHLFITLKSLLIPAIRWMEQLNDDYLAVNADWPNY
jgi:hypothetical protein